MKLSDKETKILEIISKNGSILTTPVLKVFSQFWVKSFPSNTDGYYIMENVRRFETGKFIYYWDNERLSIALETGLISEKLYNIAITKDFD